MACAFCPENPLAWTGLLTIQYALTFVYMGIKVSQARKRFGIKYPQLYANKGDCKEEKDVMAYNCVQRGHQNTVEDASTFLPLFAFATFINPAIAAACEYNTAYATTPALLPLHKQVLLLVSVTHHVHFV
eukprot:m.5906 g.5906  ORF g.5906 m.5906 type:complete len:130 (+) comp5102_c0_seq1:396-785(+)